MVLQTLNIQLDEYDKAIYEDIKTGNFLDDIGNDYDCILLDLRKLSGRILVEARRKISGNHNYIYIALIILHYLLWFS